MVLRSSRNNNILFSGALIFIFIFFSAFTQAEEAPESASPQYCKFNADNECIEVDISKGFDEVCGSPEEDDDCYDITPPPQSALKRNQLDGQGAAYQVRPDSWPFRAIYSDPEMTLGALEFDSKGNLLDAAGKAWNGAYVTEFYRDGSPVWGHNGYKVYYIVHPDKQDPIVEQGFVVSDDFKHICPAVQIAQSYSAIKQGGDYLYLRGDCAQEQPVEVEGHTFWSYSNGSMIWTIQRFDEPKKPVYDRSGTCRLYCDVLQAYAP